MFFLPQRGHAQTVRDCSSSYKIDYDIVIKNFLNPEGHQNWISDSKVRAILLKGWILPTGGASAVEGLRSTGLPCLVLRELKILNRVNILFHQIIPLAHWIPLNTNTFYFWKLSTLWKSWMHVWNTTFDNSSYLSIMNQL